MKFFLRSCFILIFFLSCYILFKYNKYMTPPETRLSLSEVYPDFLPDSRKHYIDLPVDHFDKNSEKFRGFYLLNPSFKEKSDVVFFLTDGQMELVDTSPDFNFFDEILGKDISYVLIGRRGHNPTLFPEIYDDKKLNYQKAVNLYSSKQYVEDIELIRKDMVEKKLLRSDGKIMLFGASGAGFLNQQYLNKYGRNVQRTIISSSGAPDISKKNNRSYSNDLNNFNLSGEKTIINIIKNRKYINIASLSYLLYQTARGSENPISDQNKLIKKIDKSYLNYIKKLLVPQNNLNLIKLMMKSPYAVASKVRWYELVRSDLKRYIKQKHSPINLLNEFSIEILSDFLKNEQNGIISYKDFDIDREKYTGEVLIICGSEDIVFSVDINRKIADSYKNSRIVIFNDGHRLLKEKEFYRNLRNSFLKYGFNSSEFEEKFNSELNIIYK